MDVKVVHMQEGELRGASYSQQELYLLDLVLEVLSTDARPCARRMSTRRVSARSARLWACTILLNKRQPDGLVHDDLPFLLGVLP